MDEHEEFFENFLKTGEWLSKQAREYIDSNDMGNLDKCRELNRRLDQWKRDYDKFYETAT